MKKLTTRPAGSQSRIGVTIACLAIVGFAARPVSSQEGKPHGFETDIKKFEALDEQTPPPERPILFVGSSTIRLWDVASAFPGLPVMNRGFGGSQIADSVYFADRIVIKYKPKLIVFYAGDNDLASGKGPEEVAADFRAFVAKVHAALPETRIAFIAIKPSTVRWMLVDKQREVNREIAEFVKSNPKLEFVEWGDVLLDNEGKPRADLLRADGLHLNAAGYERLNALVAPIVKGADVAR